MRIAQTRLSIDTAPREIKEITAEITRWVERQHIALELLTVYISHTSASLLIQETASPDVRRDLDAFLRRIVPEDMSLYRRNDEGPDDMTAHIKERAQDAAVSIAPLPAALSDSILIQACSIQRARCRSLRALRSNGEKVTRRRCPFQMPVSMLCAVNKDCSSSPINRPRYERCTASSHPTAVSAWPCGAVSSINLFMLHWLRPSNVT